jgi:hypothetical protein
LGLSHSSSTLASFKKVVFGGSGGKGVCLANDKYDVTGVDSLI